MKMGSGGVCDLWPVAEPSQNKRKRARSLINKPIGKSRSQRIERSVGRWMDRWMERASSSLEMHV